MAFNSNLTEFAVIILIAIIVVGVGFTIFVYSKRKLVEMLEIIERDSEIFEN